MPYLAATTYRRQLMTKLADKIEALEGRKEPPRCRDFDEDCDKVRNKLNCYLYDPAKGYCPYLREANR